MAAPTSEPILGREAKRSSAAEAAILLVTAILPANQPQLQQVSSEVSTMTRAFMACVCVLLMLPWAFGLPGCDGPVRNGVHIPLECGIGDVYIGEYKYELLKKRPMSPSYYGDDSYSNIEPFIETFHGQGLLLEAAFYDFEYGYLRSMTIMPVSNNRQTFDHFDSICVVKFGQRSRMLYTPDSLVPELFRIWKIADRQYVVLTWQQSLDTTQARGCILLCFGPDGEWEGLPEWNFMDYDLALAE